MQKIIYSLIALSISILPVSLFSDEEEVDRGGIEEITVTAEKRTSTVSDTSMSITAFDSSLIEDLGICLLYTSPSPRDLRKSRMPSSA